MPDLVDPLDSEDRYHGVLAPSARDRDKIVARTQDDPEPAAASTNHPCPHRLPWAKLLARVFAIDVTQCPSCGGRMKIIAALTEPVSIRAYLEGVGLPARPPPTAPAAPRPQHELEFAA